MPFKERQKLYKAGLRLTSEKRRRIYEAGLRLRMDTLKKRVLYNTIVSIRKPKKKKSTKASRKEAYIARCRVNHQKMAHNKFIVSLFAKDPIENAYKKMLEKMKEEARRKDMAYAKRKLDKSITIN